MEFNHYFRLHLHRVHREKLFYLRIKYIKFFLNPHKTPRKYVWLEREIFLIYTGGTYSEHWDLGV
jgi:hypothetical protein